MGVIFLKMGVFFRECEDLSNTRESVSSYHITSKFAKKYSAASRIFNYLLGVWECNEKLSLVFDILLTKEIGRHRNANS